MSVRHQVFTRFSRENVTRIIAAVARAWSRRRLIGQLGALDDHMLADIGVTRQDVQSVLAESFFVDPSERLAERAAVTRRARLSAMRHARLEEWPYAPVPARGPDRHAA